MPHEPHKGWGAAARLAQLLSPLGFRMERCPEGAAPLQPHKLAVQRGYLGRGRAGICLRRTMGTGNVENWGFIEVLHQLD